MTTTHAARRPASIWAKWWNPTPTLARRTAGGVAIVLGLVIITGAAVRLTNSGLGCPTWPKCTGTDVHSGTGFHSLIEFGNRLISVFVFLAGIALLALVTIRSRRRDLYPHVGGLAAGYLGEAVLGGISVLTHLNPLIVAAHFLFAVGLLWIAIVVWRRLGTEDVAPTPVVRTELRWLGRGLLAGAGLILVLGTLVTGTGPHAGSRVDNRLPFNRRDITALHSDSVLFLVGAVAVTLLVLKLTDAPPRLQRRGRVLLATMLLQAAIGFIQYFAGLPAWLVGVHVAGATLFWVACLLLVLDMWERPVAVEKSSAAADVLPSAAALQSA
jgi:cytochrome c oxidase assembly protein subunit 15